MGSLFLWEGGGEISNICCVRFFCYILFRACVFSFLFSSFFLC